MTSNWYIVHAYSNFEKKVADAILLSAKEKGLEEMIEEVYVADRRSDGAPARSQSKHRASLLSGLRARQDGSQ